MVPTTDAPVKCEYFPSCVKPRRSPMCLILSPQNPMQFPFRAAVASRRHVEANTGLAQAYQFTGRKRMPGECIRHHGAVERCTGFHWMSRLREALRGQDIAKVWTLLDEMEDVNRRANKDWLSAVHMAAAERLMRVMLGLETAYKANLRLLDALG